MWVGLWIVLAAAALRDGYAAYVAAERAVSDDANCVAFSRFEGPTPESCVRAVAVIEPFPFHDEVIPTSVHLVQSAGADCVHVVKPFHGNREYDILDSHAGVDTVRSHGELGFAFEDVEAATQTHGLANSEQLLHTTRFDLVVINTFMGGAIRYVDMIYKILRILTNGAVNTGNKRLTSSSGATSSDSSWTCTKKRRRSSRSFPRRSWCSSRARGDPRRQRTLPSRTVAVRADRQGHRLGPLFLWSPRDPIQASRKRGQLG